ARGGRGLDALDGLDAGERFLERYSHLALDGLRGRALVLGGDERLRQFERREQLLLERCGADHPEDRGTEGDQGGEGAIAQTQASEGEHRCPSERGCDTVILRRARFPPGWGKPPGPALGDHRGGLSAASEQAPQRGFHPSSSRLGRCPSGPRRADSVRSERRWRALRSRSTPMRSTNETTAAATQARQTTADGGSLNVCELR